MIAHLRCAALLGAILLTACACPTNETATPTAAGKYERERVAACSAVIGCDLEFVASVKVYEAPLAEIPERCDAASDVNGCFCSNLGCHTILLFTCDLDDTTCLLTQRRVALHEHVHAAAASVGEDTHDHGPVFQEALLRARQLIAKTPVPFE